MALVASAGAIAPDATGAQPTGGATFKAFKSVSIHDGSIGIFAQLTGGVGPLKASAANDLGLWLKDGGTFRLAFRTGQTVGGKTIKSLVTFLPGAGSPGQGRGWVGRYGEGEAHVLALFTDKTQGILLQNLDDHTPSILSLSGSITDGPPDIGDATFASYSFPAHNDAGATSFAATLNVDAASHVTKADVRGIFLSSNSGDAYKPLARIGKPSGILSAAFSKLSDPVLSEDGSVAFTGTLNGGTAKGLATKTLWWKPAGQRLQLLAQGGAATVGDLSGAQWNSFDSLAITDRGPLFAAKLVPNKTNVTSKTASGVWACDFTGALRLLFRTGDTTIIARLTEH